MNDKNLFQITCDVIGYSPGGEPRDGKLYVRRVDRDKIEEVNRRFYALVDSENAKVFKEIEEAESKKKPTDRIKNKLLAYCDLILEGD